MTTTKRAMPALVDQGLGRTDYVAYWDEQARVHARTHSWQASIDDVTACLISTFGRDWLEEEARRPERLPMVGTRGKHPLGQMLALTSARNAARVVELGVYLKRCTPVPNLADVVAHLRAEQQYEGARLQLALAYRFHRAQCSNIAFEPDVDGGRRADVVLDHDGTTYLVECYAPVTARHAEYEQLLSSTLTSIFNAASKRGVRVVVRVALASAASVDAPMRRRIETTFARLLDQLKPRAREIANDPTFELEVIDTSGIEERHVRDIAWSFGDWDAWIVNEKLVAADRLAEIHRSGKPDGTARSWIVVTRGDAGVELSGLIERLAHSVEQKVSQVRRAGAMGVITVKSPIAGLALSGDRNAWSAIDQIKTKVLGGHERVAAVWLVDEGADDNHRPSIGGVVVSRKGCSFESLVDSIRQIELARDVLNDPELTGGSVLTPVAASSR
jgi:hypothetical protein